MEKFEYRKKAKSYNEIPYSQVALIKAIKECKVFQESNTILSFYAIKGEIDLSVLEELYPEKRFLYPVVEGCDMYFTSAQEYKQNKWGIKEPIGEEVEYENAVMLTPALLFDKALNRLGRGKGFYDRYIKRYGDKLYTIGICKTKQLEEKLPADEYDQKVNALIILPEMGENYVLLT